MVGWLCGAFISFPPSSPIHILSHIISFHSLPPSPPSCPPRRSNLEELDLSTTEITRTGAQAAAELAKNLLPGFRLLKINGNSISRDGQLAVAELLGIQVDDVEELSGGKGVLGPLDENDDEGGEEE